VDEMGRFKSWTGSKNEGLSLVQGPMSWSGSCSLQGADLPAATLFWSVKRVPRRRVAPCRIDRVAPAAPQSRMGKRKGLA